MKAEIVATIGGISLQYYSKTKNTCGCGSAGNFCYGVCEDGHTCLGCIVKFIIEDSNRRNDFATASPEDQAKFLTEIKTWAGNNVDILL